MLEASGEISDDEFGSFLLNTLGVLETASRASALHYVFSDWRHISELTAAAKYLQLPLLDIAVWTKPDGRTGGLYRSAHELCAVFRAVAASPWQDFGLSKHRRDRLNVWDYPVADGSQWTPGSHPPPKPVAMLADILRDCTKRGDLVIDTCLRSGSTLIAAQQTGRICVGTDADPNFVDLAIRRWQRMTGKDAIHLGTGRRFDDLASHLLMYQGGSHGE